MPGGDSGISYSREGVATTVAVDLFEILMNDNGIDTVIGGLWISQSSDVGDAAEEIIRWRFVVGNTSSGSGGAAPDEWETGYRSGGTNIAAIESFNTTAASGGTPVNGPANGFNIRAGEQIWFPPGYEPWIQDPDGSGIVNVIRLMAAPADSLTMSAVIFVPYERRL